MKRHSAHVDANVLAELSAGLISDKRATRIHAHLAGCQQCARLSAGLTEIAALLASVPSPAMPESVTRQLQATLTREAAERSARVTAPRRPPAKADRSCSAFPQRPRPCWHRPAAPRLAWRPARLHRTGGGARFRRCGRGLCGGGGRLHGGPAHLGRLGAILWPPSGGSSGGLWREQQARGPALHRPDPGPRVGWGERPVVQGDQQRHRLPVRDPQRADQGRAGSRRRPRAGPVVRSQVPARPGTQQYACVMDVTGDISPRWWIRRATTAAQPPSSRWPTWEIRSVRPGWSGRPARPITTDILKHVTLPTAGG